MLWAMETQGVGTDNASTSSLSLLTAKLEHGFAQWVASGASREVLRCAGRGRASDTRVRSKSPDGGDEPGVGTSPVLTNGCRE